MESHKKKRLADYKILGALVPVLLLLVWESANRSGILSASILPPPTRLFSTFLDLWKDGTLQKNILVSMRRVLFGYFFGASVGVIVGIAIGLFPLVKRLLSIILEILRPIPILAWVPVLILWSGIGETSKVVTIAIGSFWSVLLNTSDGVENVDIKYKEVAEIYMKTKKDTIFNVILPASLPSIFTGLRVGIGSAWLSVIGAEMVAASSGLGYFITYSREMMKPAKMYVGVIIIGIIGWLINVLIRKLEKRLLRWNTAGREKK